MSILWLCVTVYVLVFFLDLAAIAPKRQVFFYLGFSYDGVVHHLWIHQFLTAALLHGGLTHLVFNMLALWMLGPGVERTLGRASYVLFSIICAVSGFAGFLLFNWQTDNVAVGYSGVVFGIVIAQAIYFPNSLIVLFGIFPLKMKYAALLLGAIELLLTISPEHGGVANSAHLFGALGALVYLKHPRLHMSLRRDASQTVSSAGIDCQEPPAREWGPVGASIAAALRETANGQHASARRCLKQARIPWRLLWTVHDIRRMITLAECFDTTGAERSRYKAEQKAQGIWKRLETQHLYMGLPPLAHVGLRLGDQMLSRLLETLCNPRLSRMPTAVRQSLEDVLAETGSQGLEILLAQFADSSTPLENANRLRILLPAMNLKKHTSVLIRIYAQAQPEGQVRLANWLAGMKDNSVDAMLDLLAGILNRMPPDLRLARAIQETVGTSTLEQTASRWAAGGHRGAQTVLARLYS